MRKNNIDHYFNLLAKEIKKPMTILLTGGAAAILQGVERATEDIDFEISKIDNREEFDRALQLVSRKTGIDPQYSEDIDHWSMIALPSKKSALYKKFGSLEVRILDPALWALGKLTRYLASDESDLVDVLKKTSAKPETIVRLWAKAVRLSPASSSQGQFIRHVEYFLNRYSTLIWGKKAQPESLIASFKSRVEKVNE